MLEKTLLNNEKLNKLLSYCTAKDIIIDSVIYDNPSNTYCIRIKSSFLFSQVFEYSDGVIIDFKDNDIIQAYIENV